jgi:carbonic anhydrase/acetyltransferase-like protein (isoleucine patch superfamily)
MPLFAFEGRKPTISPTAWIAPTATLVGDVRVEDAASIWYGAVLRADFGPIIVRRARTFRTALSCTAARIR